MIHANTNVKVLKNVITDAAQDPGKLFTVHVQTNDDLLVTHMSCDPADIEFDKNGIMSIQAGTTELNIDVSECTMIRESLPDDPNIDESIELVGDSWSVNLDLV